MKDKKIQSAILQMTEDKQQKMNQIRRTMDKMTDSNKKKNSRFHQVDHLDHFKIVEKAVRMKNMLTIFYRGSKLIRERRRG